MWILLIVLCWSGCSPDQKPDSHRGAIAFGDVNSAAHHSFKELLHKYYPNDKFFANWDTFFQPAITWARTHGAPEDKLVLDSVGFVILEMQDVLRSHRIRIPRYLGSLPQFLAGIRVLSEARRPGRPAKDREELVQDGIAILQNVTKLKREYWGLRQPVIEDACEVMQQKKDCELFAFQYTIAEGIISRFCGPNRVYQATCEDALRFVPLAPSRESPPEYLEYLVPFYTSIVTAIDKLMNQPFSSPVNRFKTSIATTVDQAAGAGTMAAWSKARN